jgi:molybdate/tungstate transport system substrate-binding protein
MTLSAHLRSIAIVLIAMSLASSAAAQAPACVPPSDQQLIIYRAGSLSRAFNPLEAAFTCQTGIQIKLVAMGSLDAGRQITAGGHPCDLYAPADYLDIDLFLKPAGFADFTILFAQGRMVLAYSAASVAEKKLPPIAASGSAAFHPPDSIPEAAPNWYQILTTPGVAIGGGNPFLDPGAYRANLIFQLAEKRYKVPNLYNNLLEHVVIPGADHSGPALGKRFDFQLIYEHSAQVLAAANPDFRYVSLPDEINLSDPNRNSEYANSAHIVLPGLGTPESAPDITVPATRVAWGITMLKNAPNPRNATQFLELLLSPAGTDLLRSNGPAPISPAQVSARDLAKLPASLRPLVQAEVPAPATASHKR